MTERALSGLRPRHRVVAQLILAGWTQAAIAAELGYAESYVSVITGSPLFREIVTSLQERSVQAALDVIHREAKRSAETMAELRDGANGTKGETTRLQAANLLLGRAIPAKSRFAEGLSKAQGPTTAQPLQLSIDEVHELRIAVQEDEAELPRFRRTKLVEPPGAPPPMRQATAEIRLQTVDEAMAALREPD